MKKIASICLVFVAMFATVKAQDINSVFATVPEDIVFGLDAESKDHLLSNLDDSTTYAETVIYERLERLGISDDYIGLRTSPVATTEIKLLPLVNGSKIVCVVQTVAGKIEDSRISFYTDKWQPISSDGLFPARDVEWFVKIGIDRNDEKYTHLLSIVDMTPMKYTLSAKDTNISVEFDMKTVLPLEEHKNVEQYFITDTKILKWNKVRFQ